MYKTISLLILVSTALHAAVLGLIDFNASTEVVPAGSLMRISIQAPSSQSIETTNISKQVVKKPQQKKAKKTQTTPEVKPKIIPVNTATRTPKERIVQRIEPIKQITPPSKDVAIASASTPSSIPESTTSLLYSDLNRAFELHFYYPRIAIKRGWQGQVKISLRVEADGHLTRVRLLNSSGYNLLDNAAMATIDKVKILPTAIALLNGQTMDLIFPVEYHLL